MNPVETMRKESAEALDLARKLAAEGMVEEALQAAFYAGIREADAEADERQEARAILSETDAALRLTQDERDQLARALWSGVELNGLPDKPYVHERVLGEGPNVSHRKMDVYDKWLAWALSMLAVTLMILGIVQVWP